MAEPCEQAEVISAIRKEQEDTRNQNLKILTNQELLARQQADLVKKLDDFFDRLERLLVTDMERRKDIAQLSKDYDMLYGSLQAQAERLEDLEHERIRNEGLADKLVQLKAQVVENNKFIEQEKGWRRLISPTIALCGVVIALVALLA